MFTISLRALEEPPLTGSILVWAKHGLIYLFLIIVRLSQRRICIVPFKKAN